MLKVLQISDKESARNMRDPGSSPRSGRSPLEKEMATHSSFLPREFHGQRNLVGYSPWGHKESDTTEYLRLTFFLMFTFENDIALQINDF